MTTLQRAHALGLRLLALEAAERRGAGLVVYTSFPAAPGSGLWLAAVRRPGEERVWRPRKDYDLMTLLEMAAEEATRA